MHRLAEGLVHAASDLNAFAECVHLIALERDVALGGSHRPEVPSETMDLIARKGLEHERRHLARLEATFGANLVRFDDWPVRSREGYAEAEAATLAAMASGAPAIYQATLFDGTFLGRADFLMRVERPCARWPWSYEVVDTKLALSPKPYFLVQLCQYSEHVARLQGTAPRAARIVLGTGEPWSFEVETYAAYIRHLKQRYLESVAAGEDAYPLECAHCERCAWRAACARRRDEDDHLSLVAFMRRDQLLRLEEAGIATLGALAVAADRDRPKRMARESYDYLRAQAAEQDRYRRARASGTAVHSYAFRPAADGAGFARLPEPQPGDVFFDIEGDPLYRPGASLEYLFGCYLPDEPREERYLAFWGTSPADERLAFEGFVDFVRERRLRYPGLHVYHYAPYETTALKRLGGRFGSREDDVDTFLRDELFVDLYAVVRQALWISQPSYSIKKVEALYGFSRATQTKAGDDSIVMFESWLESQDPAILEDIRRYNEDDCRSTFVLREWLARLRREFNAQRATPVPWRPRIVRPAEPAAPESALQTELERELLRGVPMPQTEVDLRARPERDRERWLLGNLLQYHRREAKAEWWEFFRRVEQPTEMVADRQALGGLKWLREILPYRHGPRDRSEVYTFAFPEQEYDLGGSPVDVDTRSSVGAVISIDDDRRRIAIKLANKTKPESLRAIVPGGPLNTKAHRAQLAAIAVSYRDGRLDFDHPATAALLARRLPSLRGCAPGATIQPGRLTLEAISAIVRSVRSGALVVQGPPGTGKTTAGAHAIVDLLLAKKRVALTALSHKALHNLLRKIEDVAKERGAVFRACHRASEGEGSSFASRHAEAIVADARDGDLSSCDLVSVTTFGWANQLERDSALAGSFDVLVVDEAGQIALADALIVSRLAPVAILLGDAQQLPHVAQGSHPVGTDASILAHLLGGAATIPPERGLFLDRSFRLEPRTADFVSQKFYDGRLRAASENARNRVDSEGLAGAGMRYLPIYHDGNARRSDAEAERIVREVVLLLGGGTTTLRGDAPRPLGAADVLVVAPYNAQRAEIRKRLEAVGLAAVAVGTVDKFQGQEAPVVIYSMATSTAELAPRGLDFLLSPNRLNVAISRAEALAVVACSPLLLASRATTIEHMRLLSLLCAYAEHAR